MRATKSSIIDARMAPHASYKQTIQPQNHLTTHATCRHWTWVAVSLDQPINSPVLLVAAAGMTAASLLIPILFGGFVQISQIFVAHDSGYFNPAKTRYPTRLAFLGIAKDFHVSSKLDWCSAGVHGID